MTTKINISAETKQKQTLRRKKYFVAKISDIESEVFNTSQDIYNIEEYEKNSTIFEQKNSKMETNLMLNTNNVVSVNSDLMFEQNEKNKNGSVKSMNNIDETIQNELLKCKSNKEYETNSDDSLSSYTAELNCNESLKSNESDISQTSENRPVQVNKPKHNFLSENLRFNTNNSVSRNSNDSEYESDGNIKEISSLNSYEINKIIGVNDNSFKKKLNVVSTDSNNQGIKKKMLADTKLETDSKTVSIKSKNNNTDNTNQYKSFLSNELEPILDNQTNSNKILTNCTDKSELNELIESHESNVSKNNILKIEPNQDSIITDIFCSKNGSYETINNDVDQSITKTVSIEVNINYLGTSVMETNVLPDNNNMIVENHNFCTASESVENFNFGEDKSNKDVSNLVNDANSNNILSNCSSPEAEHNKSFEGNEFDTDQSIISEIEPEKVNIIGGFENAIIETNLSSDSDNMILENPSVVPTSELVENDKLVEDKPIEYVPNLDYDVNSTDLLGNCSTPRLDITGFEKNDFDDSQSFISDIENDDTTENISFKNSTPETNLLPDSTNLEFEINEVSESQFDENKSISDNTHETAQFEPFGSNEYKPNIVNETNSNRILNNCSSPEPEHIEYLDNNKFDADLNISTSDPKLINTLVNFDKSTTGMIALTENYSFHSASEVIQNRKVNYKSDAYASDLFNIADSNDILINYPPTEAEHNKHFEINKCDADQSIISETEPEKVNIIASFENAIIETNLSPDSNNMILENPSIVLTSELVENNKFEEDKPIEYVPNLDYDVNSTDLLENCLTPELKHNRPFERNEFNDQSIISDIENEAVNNIVNFVNSTTETNLLPDSTNLGFESNEVPESQFDENKSISDNTHETAQFEPFGSNAYELNIDNENNPIYISNNCSSPEPEHIEYLDSNKFDADLNISTTDLNISTTDLNISTTDPELLNNLIDFEMPTPDLNVLEENDSFHSASELFQNFINVNSLNFDIDNNSDGITSNRSPPEAKQNKYLEKNERDADQRIISEINPENKYVINNYIQTAENSATEINVLSESNTLMFGQTTGLGPELEPLKIKLFRSGESELNMACVINSDKTLNSYSIIEENNETLKMNEFNVDSSISDLPPELSNRINSTISDLDTLSVPNSNFLIDPNYDVTSNSKNNCIAPKKNKTFQMSSDFSKLRNLSEIKIKKIRQMNIHSDYNGQFSNVKARKHSKSLGSNNLALESETSSMTKANLKVSKNISEPTNLDQSPKISNIIDLTLDSKFESEPETNTKTEEILKVPKYTTKQIADNKPITIVGSIDLTLCPFNGKVNVRRCTCSQKEAQETLVKDNTNFALAIQPKMNDLSSTPPCIELSLSLKKIIQMDFNMVNVFNKVSPYTQQYSVADIVSLYINKHPIISKPEAFEFGCFLIALFNLHVNTKLLYKNERYMNLTFKAAKYFNTKLRFIKKNDYTFVRFSFQKKMWCYVYPPIYLLRLFAQLPSTKVRMNGDKWLYFSHFVKDFIDYLDQYKTIFFTKYYFPMNKL